MPESCTLLELSIHTEPSPDEPPLQASALHDHGRQGRAKGHLGTSASVAPRPPAGTGHEARRQRAPASLLAAPALAAGGAVACRRALHANMQPEGVLPPLVAEVALLVKSPGVRVRPEPGPAQYGNTIEGDVVDRQHDLGAVPAAAEPLPRGLVDGLPAELDVV